MHTPTLGARPLRALGAALAVIAVSLVAAAPRASADTTTFSGNQACNYDGRSYYACHILKNSPAYFFSDDFAFLHVNMPEQYAREVIACGADFRASLWGNDGSGGMDSEDDLIRIMQLDPGWPRADWSGIEAHFSGLTLSSSSLNEDGDDDSDEIYVRISFYDCHTGQTRTFMTDDLVGELRGWS
jgi:hypothetical protein